jgi:hypothetical protein
MKSTHFRENPNALAMWRFSKYEPILQTLRVMHKFFELHQKSVGLVFKLIDNASLIKYKHHFNVICYWQ